MKSKFAKVIGTSAVTLSLAMLPLIAPVHAQTSNTGGSSTGNSTGTTTTTNPDTTTTGRADYGYTRNNFDWGWLGLLGLIGLAGMAGKKRYEEPNRYRDPNTVSGTTYRE